MEQNSLFPRRKSSADIIMQVSVAFAFVDFYNRDSKFPFARVSNDAKFSLITYDFNSFLAAC